eukprot:m.1124677 g.1124677  ORF g.1124677 m.1124677 type:complete len:296 (+) comp24407_c1_seq44:381-1268(+)
MIVVVNALPEDIRGDHMLLSAHGHSPLDVFRLGPYTSSTDSPAPPINWAVLKSGSFAATVLIACGVGLLGLLEDLAVVHKATAITDCRASAAVDIDREVQLQGLLNMVVGVVAGLPVNMVGSYSMTVLRMGARGRWFWIPMASGTTVFLVAAKQLLSVLPVMVPCFILFWVALELTLWGLWSLRPEMGCGNTTETSRDDRGHTHGHAHPAADDGSDAPREALRPLEYTLVVAMVFVSLVPFNKILSDETGLVGMYSGRLRVAHECMLCCTLGRYRVCMGTFPFDARNVYVIPGEL